MPACLVAQSCPSLCDPMDCSPSGSSVHGISPGKREYWSGLPLPSPADLPNPGIEPGSPALQADALPSEPPGKILIFTRSTVFYFFLVTSLMKSERLA